MTVLRLSRGIACRPDFTASSTELISVGIEVSFIAITSPFFNGGESPFRGSNSTYCSPIADWLCTSAVRSRGMSMPDLSDSCTKTPVSLR